MFNDRQLEKRNRSEMNIPLFLIMIYRFLDGVKLAYIVCCETIKLECRPRGLVGSVPALTLKLMVWYLTLKLMVI